LHVAFYLLGGSVVVFNEKVEGAAFDGAFESVACELTGKLFALLIEVEAVVEVSAEVVDIGIPVAGKGGVV
jgi:hypothetical protein